MIMQLDEMKKYNIAIWLYVAVNAATNAKRFG
jgi:hypothetical protein